VVRDNPKLLDDCGEILKSQEEVGDSTPSCEISSLLDKKLARWSTASCALALACWPSISKKEKEKEKDYSIRKAL
jgi:hypothetical protein